MIILGEGAWDALMNNPGSVTMVAGCAMIVLIVAIGTITRYWYLVAKARADADLKHDMLQRGMSADEIERILQARSPEK